MARQASARNKKIRLPTELEDGWENAVIVACQRCLGNIPVPHPDPVAHTNAVPPAGSPPEAAGIQGNESALDLNVPHSNPVPTPEPVTPISGDAPAMESNLQGLHRYPEPPPLESAEKITPAAVPRVSLFAPSLPSSPRLPTAESPKLANGATVSDEDEADLPSASESEDRNAEKRPGPLTKSQLQELRDLHNEWTKTITRKAEEYNVSRLTITTNMGIDNREKRKMSLWNKWQALYWHNADIRSSDDGEMEVEIDCREEEHGEKVKARG